jgi:hypothetical protein
MYMRECRLAGAESDEKGEALLMECYKIISQKEEEFL